jgi:ATP-dependent Clp protease protease subunit
MKQLLQLLATNARADKAPAIRAEAGKVYIYDVIDRDWGASAKALIDALAPYAGQPVALHINSPGGDVFEARAMVAAVRNHGAPVTTYIDGLAASAATYLALAGDKVHITDGGLFMVHNSWTLAWGNKHEMRSTADLLDKIDGTIANDYARKTGATAEQIAAWMDAETWFTAAEAKAAGFVDEVSDGSDDATKAAARWNLSAYTNAPKPQPEPQPDAAELAAQADRLQRLNRSRLALLPATPN